MGVRGYLRRVMGNGYATIREECMKFPIRLLVAVFYAIVGFFIGMIAGATLAYMIGSAFQLYGVDLLALAYLLESIQRIVPVIFCVISGLYGFF